MDSATFYDRLHAEYGGEIIAIERYLNRKSTIRFHCGKCNTVFFNRPDYLFDGKQSRHLCGQSQRSTGGTRHKANAVAKNTQEKIKVKLPKKKQEEIKSLLEKNVSIFYTALQVGLNVSSVRFFIENELRNELQQLTELEDS